MGRIQLDLATLAQSSSSLTNAAAAIQNAKQTILRLEQRPFTLQGGSRSLLTQFHQDASYNKGRIESLQAFVNTSAQLYETMEQTIRKNAQSMFPLQVRSAMQTASSTWKKKIGTEPKHWKHYKNAFTTSGYNSFKLDRGISSLVKYGATISGSANYFLSGIQYENNIGNWRNRAQLSVGNAEISGSFKAALKKEGVYDPNLTVKVGAEASAVKGSISSRYVHRYGEIGGSASAEVGVAAAKAKAVISKKEVTIEGEVGAAAVGGKATGKISLFGITITGSISGDVGSIGASGKFSTTSDSVEFGGHLSFLFGAGFNLKIDY